MLEKNDRLLRLSEVVERVGVSGTTIYREQARGRFPRPVKVGAASRWSELDIERWMAERREASS